MKKLIPSLIALAIAVVTSCKKDTNSIESSHVEIKKATAATACNNAPALIGLRTFGGPNTDAGARIQVDAQGNVTTTGIFSYKVDFDPGVGVSNMTFPDDLRNKGYFGIFIQKMNALGNFVSVAYGGVYTGSIPDLDSYGNKYVFGFENGKIAVSKLSPSGKLLGKIYLGSAGSEDNYFGIKFFGDYAYICAYGYLYKYDTSGKQIWKAPAFTRAHRLFVDRQGNAYIAAINDSGLQKFDPNGNSLWLVRNKGALYFYNAVTTTLISDKSGNVYAAGNYYGNIDFDPGTGQTLLPGDNMNQNIFIQKLSADGQFIWAVSVRSLIGGGVAQPNEIAIDASEKNLYITGSFNGQYNFNPAVNATPVTTPVSNISDVFVMQLQQCNNDERD